MRYFKALFGGIVLQDSTKALFEGLIKGDRYSLARSITLIESSRREHYEQGQMLLERCLARLQNTSKRTLRIGFSGPPGVGKSTFIEGFGTYLCSLDSTNDKKVAVLAVDPSSSKNGGSLLGDKTRMTQLTRLEGAYVRPSPSRGSLGGVARTTLESILLCESTGYPIILVETVGVGQSETLVSQMVDLFILLVPPASGDELQGMKRGIMELADMLIVNKADGDLLPAANLAALEYTSALKYLNSNTPNWRVPVLLASSLDPKTFPRIYQTINDYLSTSQKGCLHLPTASTNDKSSGSGSKFNCPCHFDRKRKFQLKQWLWRTVSESLIQALKDDEGLAKFASRLEDNVLKGLTTPGRAADEIVREFHKTSTLK